MILLICLSKILEDENTPYIKDNEKEITNQIDYLLSLMYDNSELFKTVLFTINEKIKEYNRQNNSGISLCSLYREIKNAIDIDSKYNKGINLYKTRLQTINYFEDFTIPKNLKKKYNKSYNAYLLKKNKEIPLLIKDITSALDNNINNIEHSIKASKKVQPVDDTDVRSIQNPKDNNFLDENINDFEF